MGPDMIEYATGGGLGDVDGGGLKDRALIA